MIAYFIPGQGEKGLPLERYLEVMPGKVVSRYIEAYTQPGGSILDPFCQSAVVVEEAARLGRSAQATHFSPPNVLMARATFGLPPPQEIDAALVRLSEAPKREASLREHINDLYLAHCYRCHEPAVAEYLTWDGERGIPVEKGYRCPSCEAQGPSPVEDADLELLPQIEERGVHYWYLLDRLAPPGDEGRGLVQSLLELYTPRNLYALVTISMKVDSLFPPSPLREALQLILLISLDSCRKLDISGKGRARLRPPKDFLERNVWSAFEEAYQQVRSLASVREGPVPSTIAKRSLRELASRFQPESLDLIITVPPPLDRALWALFYLWTGWLYGREEAATLKPLLKPRFTDWSWYGRAVTAALRTLTPLLRPEGRLIAFLERGSLPRVRSLVLAGAEAGLRLERLILRPNEGAREAIRGKEREWRYRLSLVKEPLPPVSSTPEELTSRMVESARQACQDLLHQRGEPLLLEWLQAAILARWSEEDLIRQATRLEGIPSSFAEERMNEALQEALAQGLLCLLDQKGENLEDGDWASALWWFKEKVAFTPLSDRVEEEAHRLFQQEGPVREPMDRLYSLFPGLLTPDPGLVEEAIRSYGQEGPEGWRGRPSNWKAERVIELLFQLGERLGFQPLRGGGAHPPPYIDAAWREDEATSFLFVVRERVKWEELYGWMEEDLRARRLIIIPDERASLIEKWLKDAPLPPKGLGTLFDFIKISHLERLSLQEEIDRHDLKIIIGLTPPVESPEAQLPLFP